MFFSQHELSSNDGHWNSQYLGKNGVVRRDREVYRQAKIAFKNLLQIRDHTPERRKTAASEFFTAVMAYASTLYSARMFMPFKAAQTLCHLLDEIQSLVERGQIELTSPQKECLMAFHTYCYWHDVWVTGRVGRMDKVAKLGNQILQDHSAPLATRLLTLARMSRLNENFTRKKRKEFRAEVLKSVNFYLVRNQVSKIEQEWKTVCRLGLLTGSWNLVVQALKHDSSRDLRLKAYSQPGFVFHKLTGGIFSG